jgi:hypothetical protein
MRSIGIEFYLMVAFLFIVVFLGVLGFVVEKTSLGDKINMKNSLVEAIDEDNPD